MRLHPGHHDDLVALVRATSADSVVVVISAERDAMAMALAMAAIAPLAIARAPATRVNAVLAGASADAADVEAAVSFLERAGSTTGQVIAVI